MLERESVVASTAQFLDEIRAGRGRSLFVMGEAGLGKSTILDFARSRADPDMAVAAGRGDPMETSLPFGLVVQAIDALGGRDVLTAAPGLSTSGNTRAAQFYGFQRWVESLTSRPVLFLLDDVHWADPDSMALLSFLCRRIAGLSVGVIGTLRPWPAEAYRVALQLAAAGVAAVEVLAPLSEQASAALLATRLNHAVDASVRSQACAACAGNPLLLEQAAAAVEAGQDLSALGPASSAARQLLLTRFGGLSADAMRVAQAASILGTPFRPELASAVAEVADGDIEAALDALSRSGLFRALVDGAMEFVHALFRQSLYQDLGPPLRASLHRRAFRALVAQGRDAEAAEHAQHAHLAGDPDAIAVLERVGLVALRAGAMVAAATHLQTAVDFAGSGASPRLRVALATVALALGRLGDAIRLGEALVQDADASVSECIAALRILGRALTISNAPDQAAARFDQAVELAEPQEPTVAVEVLLDYAMASWLTAGPVKSLPLTVRARQIAPRVDIALRLRVEAAWGHMAIEAGDASGLESLSAAPKLEANVASDVIYASGAWGGIEQVFFSLGSLERFNDSDRVFELAFAAAKRIRAPESLATLATAHAFYLMRAGRLAEALENMDVVVSVGDLVPMMALYAPLGRAHILQYLGRLADSDANLARANAMITGSGFWNATLYLWEMQGHRHFMEGRPEEACCVYDGIEALAMRMGMGNPCIPPWAGHAIAAHMACGHDSEAARLIDWVEERGAQLPVRWPGIVAAVGRAGLAERAGDNTASEAHFVAALSLHDLGTLPLDQIETLIAYGAFLRRSGQTSRARAALAQAVAVAEATGAAWLGGYARRELALAGGRRRAPRPPEQLTPCERRVADLAAAGATNAAIAAQLMVSVATVETHLCHVFAKVGIHSRRQLAAMAGLNDATTPRPADLT